MKSPQFVGEVNGLLIEEIHIFAPLRTTHQELKGVWTGFTIT